MSLTVQTDDNKTGWTVQHSITNISLKLLNSTEVKMEFKYYGSSFVGLQNLDNQ